MEFHISDKMKELKPSAIREIFKYAVDPEVISLAAGDPAPESLPVNEISLIMNEIMQDPMKVLLYSQSEGHPAFREAIAEMINSRYNIGRDFDQVLVTTGAQQVMDLTVKAICNEGDTIICEAPSFIGSLNTFRSYGTNLVGVETEHDGISLEKLEIALTKNPNTRIIYVIPNFQNPTGITMSLEKRMGVYELAKKYNVVILEDNPYGDLRFEGEIIPSIKSFDTEGIVVYAGTFSKILSSGIRVGYCVSHKNLMSKLVVAKQCTDVHTSMLAQLLCYEFLKQCDLDSHIKNLTAIYKKKCTHMLTEMDKYFPSGVSHTNPQGGLFVWVTMPEYIDGNEFTMRLVKEKKICAVPGSAFMVDPTAKSNCFRVTFSMPSMENITIGIKRIGELLTEMINENK